MAKKNETVEEEVVEAEETAPEAKTPRITHDFQRHDLNELRDVVNELFEKCG